MKAILDYAIMSRNMFKNIQNMEIHDNGLYQLKVPTADPTTIP